MHLRLTNWGLAHHTTIQSHLCVIFLLRTRTGEHAPTLLDPIMEAVRGLMILSLQVSAGLGDRHSSETLVSTALGKKKGLLKKSVASKQPQS